MQIKQWQVSESYKNEKITKKTLLNFRKLINVFYFFKLFKIINQNTIQLLYIVLTVIGQYIKIPGLLV